MTRLYADFIEGTTTTNPLLIGGTTLASAVFADLPEVVAPNTLRLVLDPERVVDEPEIVIVTAHTAASTSVTITRAADGTTAREHASGTKVVLSLVTSDLGRTPGLMAPASGEYLTAPSVPVYDGTGNFGALAQDAIYFVPIVVRKAVEIDALALSCATTGTANIKLGLYDSDDEVPVNRLEAPTAVTLASTGVRSASITARTLQPGLYFLAALADGGTGGVKGMVPVFDVVNSIFGLVALRLEFPSDYATGLPAVATPNSFSSGPEPLLAVHVV